MSHCRSSFVTRLVGFAFDGHPTYSRHAASNPPSPRGRVADVVPAQRGFPINAMDRPRLVRRRFVTSNMSVRGRLVIDGLLERCGRATQSPTRQPVAFHLAQQFEASAPASTAKTCAANRTATCTHPTPSTRLARQKRSRSIDGSGQALDTPPGNARGCCCTTSSGSVGPGGVLFHRPPVTNVSR